MCVYSVCVRLGTQHVHIVAIGYIMRIILEPRVKFKMTHNNDKR